MSLLIHVYFFIPYASRLPICAPSFVSYRMLRRSFTAVRRAAFALPQPAALSLPAAVTVPKRFGGHGFHDSPAFEKLYKEMAIKAAVDPIKEGQRPDDAYTPGDGLDRMPASSALWFTFKIFAATAFAGAAMYAGTIGALVLSDDVAAPAVVAAAGAKPRTPSSIA
jgi:hypothetical protein